MNISSKKETNLSEESIKLFVQYQELQKEKNVVLHKIVLTFFIITNLIMAIFIFGIKIQLRSLNQTNLSLKEEITSVTSLEEDTKKKMYHELVNLSTKINFDNFYVTEIFRSKDEYKRIISTINYHSPNDLPYSVIICYQSSSNGDTPKVFYSECHFDNLLVLIETTSGHRFGGFTTKGFNYDSTYQAKNDSYSFLFSLDEEVKLHYIRQGHTAFKLVKDGFFVFGEDDLVINPNFRNGHMCYSKFPKSFGDPEKDHLSDLTGGEWEFEIQSMEIYGLYSLFYSGDN